jgi:penicillin-binding protein 2
MNSLVPEGRDTRLIVLRVLLVTAFAVLVIQLWQLQMIRGEYYQQAADVNRFRLEQNPAPRGVIYDRRGHLLARNKPQITVSIVPAYLPEDPAERRTLLLELGDMLQIPMTSPDHTALAKSRAQRTLAGDPDLDRGILEILEEAEIAPYRPAPLKTGVPREVALVLEEQHLDWPGVLVGVEPVREYLHGPLTSHLLGYVGPIPESQADEYQAMGYEPLRNTVGLSGVEYTFEEELRGIDGQKLVEVDVAGREVQTVGEPKTVIPGNNLNLTLDLGLQEVVEETLRKQLRTVYSKQGVVVALDPRTGEVLSIVSLPSYDNNEFTGGISRTALKELQEDRDRPLVNHAVSGMFPPGSTFKILVAAGALEEKTITTRSRYFCGGIMWLPNRFYPEDPSLAQPFYCWIHHDYHGQHGSVGVISGLGQSCDIFFYQVGGGYPNRFEGLGEERIGYYAELFGFGARTEIDLPGEAPGLVPTVKWKRVNYGESWTTGDTYNMSIGQGFVLATPLQLANATAAIANGGTLYRPQLVREITDGEGHIISAFAPDVIREVPVSPKTLDIVQQGMRSAVAGPGATAWALDVPGVAVAGKTGTAEYFIDRNKDGIPDRDREGNLPTHAWFTAYAPYKNPEIVVTVFVFGGGEGSATAVPIAGEILNYYFSQDREPVSP